MNINELRRQHQELSTIAKEILRAVQDEDRPQSVGPIRWHLARQLMSHLALEDRIFYPAMQRLSDKPARTAAQQLRSQVGTLAQDFSTYMHRWNDDKVARQWAEFCADTRKIMAALRTRVDQEERLLFPLAEAAERNAAAMSKTG
ncbi:MAG TPA: hemerythrin domain-containing protein [Sphingobium sp.]